MKNEKLELAVEPIEITEQDPPIQSQHLDDEENASTAKGDPIQLEFDFEFT
ncbi:hypothetical protein QNE65_002677 [Vibrio alginolyticus]|uniref:hypothetical protein n=1 Tax=Vibrio alginolyticus TaxID=663 RepID=UPI00215B7EA2|nr:hypothetical protein [Vibrio alginolyticus]ELB2736826.1 hypothetical protein [Vibrio alginolyticus]ELB2763862.1 hypothetical protein [Vibrio alginolyticus]MCR9521126.1 hypothetical protein [Vibrio alginolyticus]MCS0169343.1 hypothetical protein [Vibrio alginolyticus]